MSTVRNWAVGSAIAALILFGPITAFLMVIAVEILVDFAMEDATAACAVAAGAIGGFLFRRFRLHRDLTPQSKHEQCPAKRTS